MIRKNRFVCCASLFFTIGVTLFTSHAAAQTPELDVGDFKFDSPLGSAGAQIEKIEKNRFKITLDHAPEHPNWSNMLQFEIVRNAKGNDLKLEVYFLGGNSYRFNDYFYSWSYDGIQWTPIQWQKHTKNSSEGDTLIFPVFSKDRVIVGHQAPLSYPALEAMIQQWAKNPHVKVHILGKSLEGRNIYRLEITDPQSPHPPQLRWVHYFANQHPGEHNSQWRMAGMIDWLLSDAGADCRRRAICHFVLMMYPDAPSHGWYRVNAQGVDGNRSYFAGGSDQAKQAHEAYIVQKDLENLMASDTPVTDLWSMHTWSGRVEPILTPGPEIGIRTPPREELRKILQKNDPDKFIKPLAVKNKPEDDLTYWDNGAHAQFGITAVLCEGAGDIMTKEENKTSGSIIMKSLAEYYASENRR
jgi:hypothetical protein